MKKMSRETAELDMQPEYRFDFSKARPNRRFALHEGDKVYVMGRPLVEGEGPFFSGAQPEDTPAKGPTISIQVGAKAWNQWRSQNPTIDLVFEGIDLSGENLARYDLSRLNLSGLNFIGANLSYANLTGANLSGANRTEADFTGADLRDADLSGTILEKADPIGVNSIVDPGNQTKKWEAIR
jgi:hypothetical protein